MMKKSVSIITALIILTGFMIEHKPSKRELKKLFKNSIEQDDEDYIILVSNSWTADNSDGKYYTADTVRLVNINDWQIKLDYCEKVNWTFFKSNRFFLIESQSCKEPPTVKHPEKDYIFNTKVKKTKEGLCLEIRNSSGEKDIFQVLSINSSKSVDEIILLRKKTVANKK